MDSYEIFIQYRYILLPFPKSRNMYAENIDSEQQLNAEFSIFHHFVNILIRGGYESNINIYLICSSHSSHPFLLQHPKELCLKMWSHISDFIKEYRSSICNFKDTCLAFFPPSCKCSSFISEKLAFKKLVRNCRTIYCNKGLHFSFALVVYSPCKKLFSRAAFSCYEN